MEDKQEIGALGMSGLCSGQVVGNFCKVYLPLEWAQPVLFWQGFQQSLHIVMMSGDLAKLCIYLDPVV